ncbi:Uma2 family endonuclease [Pseudonocardia spinosispora]|uniref:Uma2 family endonuclease n=1 Tax=Pseudonocardia spinosispora TaxID=103441 RepID=UPI00048CD465|nr:Uma2 family endonuclease [Pseudonocardia spinosispora]
MTVLPTPPGRLLTVAEFAALGEDDQCRWELQEGNLTLSPSPTPRHVRASGRLLIQLDPQMPDDVCVLQDIDIDLQLTAPSRPGWVRRPDLVLVTKRAMDRVEREGGLLRADEIQLVIEIVSPGSRRIDRVVKRGEYADAGIPRYWIVDLDEPASLLPLHQAGELGYANDHEATGTFTTTAPYPLTINLNDLT